MGGFLSEIVRAVRASLRSEAYGLGLPSASPPRPPSLRSALARDRARGAVVAEFKRVSPGQPAPRRPERSCEAFVRAVDPGSPTGYSCLATGPRFDGSPRDVADLARLTTRPVLFKEFVVAAEQIEVAARTGAGAILLIARLEEEGLLDRPLAELAGEAHDRGLEVLLELHRSAELSRAEGVGAEMFGVNVRDLDSLAIDRPTAFRTIAEARRSGLTPLLGLSGVEGPAEAREFWAQGVDGILVGTGVARSPDPAAFVASLRRPRRGGRA